MQSYMRDEVYAFGIYGIFKNSKKTPVFHIPGRAEINSTTPNWNTLISKGNANSLAQLNIATATEVQVLGLRETISTNNNS
jgi:hypothetical protein